MDNGGHVAVRPRFYPDDQPLQPGLMPHGGSVSPHGGSVSPPSVIMQAGAIPAQSDASKGIFASVYENKIIVLIIVVIIIIIALIAYVVYRKDEPEPPKPRARRQESQPPGDNIAGTKVGAASEDAPKIEKAIEEPEALSSQSPEDLRKLLARGRAAAAKTSNANVPDPSENSSTENYKDSKSEDEILALMVESDTKETENDLVENEDNNVDVNITETMTPIESNLATEEAPSIVDLSTNTKPDTSLCSVLVKGRQCRNKPKTEGKCGLHQKNA